MFTNHSRRRHVQIKYMSRMFTCLMPIQGQKSCFPLDVRGQFYAIRTLYFLTIHRLVVGVGIIGPSCFLSINSSRKQTFRFLKWRNINAKKFFSYFVLNISTLAPFSTPLFQNAQFTLLSTYINCFFFIRTHFPLTCSI